MSLQKQMENVDRKMWVIIIKRSQLIFIDWGGLRDTRITPQKPSKSKAQNLRILKYRNSWLIWKNIYLGEVEAPLPISVAH